VSRHNPQNIKSKRKGKFDDLQEREDHSSSGGEVFERRSPNGSDPDLESFVIVDKCEADPPVNETNLSPVAAATAAETTAEITADQGGSALAKQSGEFVPANDASGSTVQNAAEPSQNSPKQTFEQTVQDIAEPLHTAPGPVVEKAGEPETPSWHAAAANKLDVVAAVAATETVEADATAAPAPVPAIPEWKRVMLEKRQKKAVETVRHHTLCCQHVSSGRSFLNVYFIVA